MSGIYIPRLEELKCDECFWCIGYRIKCPAGHREVLLGIKHPDCPLVPVPDHGRLIDKDALEQDISGSVVFSGRERNAELIGANKIINRLHHAPTIIPADGKDTNVPTREGGEG